MKHWFTLIFLLGLLAFPACKKEQTIILPSREIEIVSAKETGLVSYEVKVKMSVAQGQTFQNASLVFEDITVASDSSFIKPMHQPAGSNDTITVTLNTNRLSHDYAITAYMQTDKAKYTSDLVIRLLTGHGFFLEVIFTWWVVIFLTLLYLTFRFGNLI